MHQDFANTFCWITARKTRSQEQSVSVYLSLLKAVHGYHESHNVNSEYAWITTW